MTGILLITHGDFGASLIRSAELILGEQPNRRSIGIDLGDSVDDLQETIRQGIESVDQGEGCLLFTDVLGGSTSSSVALVLRDAEHPCITGVNLPMLLEAFMGRDETKTDQLAKACLAAGRDGIVHLMQQLERM